MKVPSLYNEDELSKSLEMQQKLAWDLEKDFNWSGGVDLTRPLVPLNKNSKLYKSLSNEQRLVLSQILGLIVNESFNEFEMSLERFRKQCFDDVLDKYPVNPEFLALGVEFFEDEHKHSLAFLRYTEIFAKELGIEVSELKAILPSMQNNKLAEVFNINSIAGGSAIWWLAAAVEEESILLYHFLRLFRNDVDPLYYQLHKNHFEEEARHASFAFMMLELIEKRSKTPLDKVIKKLDFIISDIFQVTWTFAELSKINKVKDLEHKHEFFKILSSTIPHIKEVGPIELIHSLFTETPYISMILNPSSNKNVSDALHKYRPWQIPRPKIKDMDFTCEF